MKKIAIICLILLALFIAATPYFAGLITYARYLQAIEVLSKINGVHLETIQHERKWLTSIATTHVEISNTAVIKMLTGIKDLTGIKNAPQLHFTIEHKFYHGPVVLERVEGTAEKKWHFIQTLAYSAARLDDPQHAHLEIVKGEIARAKSVIHLSGAGSSLIESLGFEHKSAEQNVAVSWESFKALLEYAPNFAKLKGKVMLPKLNISSGDKVYSVNNAVFNTDRKVGKAHLWYGTQNLLIGNYTAKSSKDFVQVNAIDITSTHTLEGKLVNYELNILVDEAQLTNKHIQKGKLNLNIDDLNPKILHRWKNFLHDIDKGKITNDDFKLLDKAFEFIPQFVKSKPKLHINYAYIIAGEPLNIDAHLAMQDKKIKKLSNVFHLLKYLEGDAFLYVPKGVLKDYISESERKRIMLATREKPLTEGEYIVEVAKATRKRLSNLEQENIFIKDKKHYVLRAKLKGDELVVNGKKHPLPF